MRVRFVPETIYHYTRDNHPFPRYIEREMDFLPPMDIEINAVTSKRRDPFFSLLNQYDWIRSYQWQSFVNMKTMDGDLIG